MKRFFFSICLAWTTLAASPAQAKVYAAIAYSAFYNWPGVATFAPSSAAAKRQALAACGYWDCKIAVWVVDGCAAMAVGRPGIVYGHGWSNSAGLLGADANALLSCRAANRGCYVLAHVCTW